MAGLSNFGECFPAGIQVPALLQSFQTWGLEQNSQQLEFQIAGEKMGSDWLAGNGADLYQQFLPFIQLPRGSRIGFWKRNEQALEESPIMYFHSDGDDCIVANNLVHFLKSFAAATSGVAELDAKNDKMDEFRSKLNAWIASKPECSATNQPAATLEKLTREMSAWLDTWNREQDSRNRANEAMQSLIAKLKHYLAVNAQPWEKANFEIILVGSKFQMKRKFFGDKEIAEAKEVEPLIRDLRKQRVAQCPERGLWNTAWLTLGPDGSATLDCDFLTDPTALFTTGAPSNADYAADFNEAKRSAYWLPAWLDEKVAASTRST